MSQSATILAITGTQQSAIAAAFASAGWRLRGTSRRSVQTAYGLSLAADLETGEGLAAALAGADVAVLTLPQDHRAGVMPRIALQVAKAAAAGGVRRLILNLAGTIFPGATGPLFDDMRAAREAVRAGAVPSVILQPTVFMDNLLAPWSLPSILQDGVLAYPAPAAAATSWLSHRSLAEFVLAAATHPGAPGQDLRIGGPAALTGDELATILAERLGRAITYRRIPLAGFAAGLNQAYGAPAGDRIASLYATLEAQPDVLAVDGSAAALLGVAPESFAEFAARQRWEVAAG